MKKKDNVNIQVAKKTRDNLKKACVKVERTMKEVTEVLIEKWIKEQKNV